MKTATICIGNSDDRLCQKYWSSFLSATNAAIKLEAAKIQFNGHSSYTAPWQNACWVVNINDEHLAKLRTALTKLAAQFDQDCIALAVGETELIPQAAPPPPIAP